MPTEYQPARQEETDQVECWDGIGDMDIGECGGKGYLSECNRVIFH